MSAEADLQRCLMRICQEIEANSKLERSGFGDALTDPLLGHLLAQSGPKTADPAKNVSFYYRTESNKIRGPKGVLCQQVRLRQSQVLTTMHHQGPLHVGQGSEEA